MHCAMMILINQLTHLYVISYNLLGCLLGKQPNSYIIYNGITELARNVELQAILSEINSHFTDLVALKEILNKQSTEISQVLPPFQII